MAKRTSKTTDENKEQLKAIVDELKENRVKSADDSVKLQSVLESLAEQTKKLVVSIDKLSVVKPAKKDIKSGFEGAGDSPTVKAKVESKVESTEKKPGIAEATGKFVKDNKSLLMGAAAAAFLMNPKLALDVLSNVASVVGNISKTFDNIAKKDVAGTFAALGKTFTDNPMIVTGLGLYAGKKALDIGKNLYDMGKGAATTVGKGLNLATKVGDAARAAIPSKVVSASGGIANTVGDVVSSGASKVGQAAAAGLSKVVPTSVMSTVGGALNTAKGIGGAALDATGAVSKFKSAMGKIATLPGLKQVLKSIPGLGLILSLGSIASRISDGDYVGAGIDLAAGIAGLFPGFGTAAALSLAGVNYARDKNMTDAQFAEELKGNQSSAEERRLGLSKPTTSSSSNVIDKIVKVESGGKFTAKNPNSTATGLGQFTKGTFEGLAKRKDSAVFGKTWEEYKASPEIQMAALKDLTKINQQHLQNKGIEATDSATYLAHFLGPGGASKLYAADNNAPLTDVIGADQIAANPGVFRGMKTVSDLKLWSAKKMGEDSSIALAKNKIAAPSKPKTETAALQTDLNKTKAETDMSTRSIMFAGLGGGGGGSNSTSVVNNNVMNVNRPDFLSRDMVATFR